MTVGRATEHTPELQFLFDLLAAGLGNAPAPVAQAIDAGLLLRLVWHHRLAPWAEPLLAIEGIASVQATLQARLRRSAIRQLAMCHDLRLLCAAFADAGVPALALKGPALSLQLFGDPARRSCRDLDFLVPPGAQATARRVLADHGYGRTASDVAVSANAVTLMHGDGRPPVELHVRFGEADILFPLAPLRLFERPAILTLAGTPVPTLPAEIAVAYAAFHGARHYWSRLYWLADIAMACRHPGIDWGKVAEVAQRTGTARHLALAAGLAHDWLDSPPVLPAPAGRDLRAVRRSRALVPPAVAPPPCSDPEIVRRIGRWRMLAAELGLARGWAKGAVLLGRLQPSGEDRAAVALPRRWAFLYYFIRVWRQLRKAWSG